MKTPKFWQKNNFWSCVLAPFSVVYGFATQWRIRRAKPYHSSAKVICIGNITAGGVGKTPVAIAMAEKYMAEGKKVFFVTRGYKGKLKNIVVDTAKHSAAETGDEARLLANTAPTIIAPNRAIGAKMAEKLGAEIIVMDDGFQNPTLYKDESWLVFDGTVGIGNGRIIPAGPLRETLANGEKRANYVLIMGEDKTGLAKLCRLPVYYGKLQAEPLTLENKKVVAFAGIGHPEKFYQTLREQGFEVVQTRDFADHYAYQTADIEALAAEASSLGAVLITTEKDFVKLKENSGKWEKMIYVLKVRAIIQQK
ncbi:MAG: tetraacyldisaccharide 4'-kinase [Alphaproteobacteria bacterium]|nr:tetraacyldisaccharide 4'-kinase [Alphaproteobacteria bacterium]